jgi:hypothetical protein
MDITFPAYFFHGVDTDSEYLRHFEKFQMEKLPQIVRSAGLLVLCDGVDGEGKRSGQLKFLLKYDE